MSSSDTHDVSKMVTIYKKLFLVLVVITAVGIGIAYMKLPLWPALVIAFAIIAIKGKVVLDAFKHLLVGRNVLILTFGLTVIFFASLLILPVWQHHGAIVGTEDVSKEYQMQEPIKPGPHGH